MDLTDAQWRRLEPLLPKPRVRKDGRGRPWRDPRDVLTGILWIMRTGAPWHDLPPRHPLARRPQRAQRDRIDPNVALLNGDRTHCKVLSLVAPALVDS